MKKQILQFLSLTVIAIFTVAISNAQITSTTSGGDWNNTSTWIGSTVPGASDNVFINGKVNVTYGAECLDITIYTNDTLQSQSGNYALTVHANITNNGVIQNSASGNLSLNISGDVQNNGKWENISTILNGTSAQDIYLEPGKTFSTDFTINNSSDTIHMLTNLVIDGYFDVGGDVLNLNNHIVEFVGTGHYFGDGTILSPSEFKGEVNMQSTTTIKGDLIITDTLRNRYNNSPTVWLNGDLTNNGAVKTNTPGTLTLRISGDLVSNGAIEGVSQNCDLYVGGDLNAYEDMEETYVQFNGTSAQDIYLEPGKTFSSDFEINNSSDTIHMLTDLVIDGYFDVGNDVLNLNNHIVEFIGTGHYFGSGTILSPSEFKGEVNMIGGTTVEGDLIITDTLRNKNNLSATVWLNGDLINNGAVKTNTPGSLTLRISGDLDSNGPIEGVSQNCDLYVGGDLNAYENMEETYVQFNGTSVQDIYLEPGKTFSSDFANSNSTDTIHMTTDLVIDGFFNVAGNVLNLNNHIVEFVGAGHYFGQGTILSPSEFKGEVNMIGGTTIEGDLIITDTLRNKNNLSATVWLNGDLTNNGAIKTNTPGTLTLRISGDITNNGTWENSSTYLNGTTDQNIALIDDQPISSDVFFDANFGSSPYQWYYNGVVLNSPDFNGETSNNLSWLVPVSNSWYGTYYCQTGIGDSRNIRVNGGIFSLEFDGVDNYVNCGHDASLNITTAITIEAWINPAGWGELVDYGFGRIVDKRRFKLFLNDGASSGYIAQSLVFIIHSGGTSYNLNTPANSVSLSSWQHVAATYDGNGDVHVYIDGVEQTLTGTMPPGKIDDNSVEDLFIGESSGQNRAFDGNIDEVRIWGVVLTNSLIKENMYRTLQGNETGLISYWQFNEISGSIAYDLVGGNNGTLYNMTDTNKIISTAPIPFYTISDGDWETSSIWASGQNVPTCPWSRAIVKRNNTLNINTELIEVIIDPTAVMTISTGNTLIVGGD